MSLISKLLSAPIALALSTSSHLRAQWVVANMRQSLGLPGPDAPALNAAFPGLRRALVLDWSPQPDHDRYALLVNPEQVALVQIGRQQAGPGPAPVLELVALRTYLARRMTSDARRLVQAACELMGEGGETAGSSGQARVRT
jgi:hypothetical protein